MLFKTCSLANVSCPSFFKNSLVGMSVSCHVSVSIGATLGAINVERKLAVYVFGGKLLHVGFMN